MRRAIVAGVVAGAILGGLAGCGDGVPAACKQDLAAEIQAVNHGYSLFSSLPGPCRGVPVEKLHDIVVQDEQQYGS